MLSHVGKLVQKRDELRRKTNSSSILSTATLDGLKAKRDYLENHLAALKAREGTINSLKQEVRKASRFSTDFEKSFMDKKSQLVRARTCLNSLLSNASSLKSSALGRFESALNSINRLSALLDKLRANSDGEGINLGASAAIDISRLARLPRLGTCGVPYLYKEICKRLHSAPFLIPIEKVLERLHQIIVDGDCINLVNDELDASLRSMKELHDALIPSLEKAQTEEKEVCMMMATALHKIAFHCAKVSEKQKRLEELWKYWSD
ncbi:hypothetical protein TcWFU_008201 [Taenia crassiceps]|uniref:Uncharacterized protein n=1 Tax=Taenia crassiceps TaxID=6207 RepID=A0ABR4QEI2_9CEST